MNRALSILLIGCCSVLISGCKIDGVFKIDVAELVGMGDNQILINADIIMPMSSEIKCHGPEAVAVVDRYFNDANLKFCAVKSVKTITDADGLERLEESLDRDSQTTSNGLSTRTVGDEHISETTYVVAFIEAKVPLDFTGSHHPSLFYLISQRSGGEVHLNLFVEGDELSDLLYSTAELTGSVTRIDTDGKTYTALNIGNLDITLFNSTAKECRVTLEGETASAPDVLVPGEGRLYRVHSNSSVAANSSVTVENGKLVSSFTDRVATLRLAGCI